jgi:ribosome biogenesis GTPase
LFSVNLWEEQTVPSREASKWRHHDAAKALRQARKQIKHNRKPDRVRRKEWIPGNWDELDDLDPPQSERIMPRGEGERRKAALAKTRATVEEEPEVEEEITFAGTTPGQRGVVVEVSTSLCRVEVDGRSLVCGLRGSLSAEETGFTNVVAVGDEVIVSANGMEQGMVEAVLPRRNMLARPDVFHDGSYRTRDRHLQQVIVANADQLLVVASWRDPQFWAELVDRYLIAAERSNLAPIVCVNKIDLAEDEAECRATLQPYLALGYRVLFTSAVSGAGVDELREALRGKTTVLAGLSGVGKSSLLAVVQPGLHLRAAEVSDWGDGRHTTSQVNLLRLEVGGFVVDTPGIREFGLSGLRRAELIRFYPEIATAAEGCRFSDCFHIHEPGCAVKAAVGQGRVSAMRYHSYRKIYHDLSV